MGEVGGATSFSTTSLQQSTWKCPGRENAQLLQSDAGGAELRVWAAEIGMRKDTVRGESHWAGRSGEGRGPHQADPLCTLQGKQG